MNKNGLGSKIMLACLLGIGIGIVVYTLLSVITYAVKAIVYACKKDKANAEKPVWNVHVVTLIITALFLVYFLVPTVL